VLEEIPPAPKQKAGCPRMSLVVVVKEKNDEDAPSKNWEDNKVHTLIAICGKIHNTMFYNFFFAKINK
jgi:hypothetical protein